MSKMFMFMSAVVTLSLLYHVFTPPLISQHSAYNTPFSLSVAPQLKSSLGRLNMEVSSSHIIRHTHTHN
jgi:hypothetical protein